MKFRENEEAVSPVIGVILMVAITVILAAVIAAFVFGMTGDMPDATKNVVINVKGIAGDNIAITIQGGTDLPRLEYLKITVGDNDDWYTTTGTGGTGKSITRLSDDDPTSHAGAFTVGSVWKSSVWKSEETGESAPLAEDESQHVIVVGVFNDGVEQILADTYL
ncbi:hypothetical protein DSECCO2_505530 [anaerobic digester metagenome]